MKNRIISTWKNAQSAKWQRMRDYYDNFVVAIVGWNSEDEKVICEKYEAFEAKYGYRKKNGELKSSAVYG